MRLLYVVLPVVIVATLGGYYYYVSASSSIVAPPASVTRTDMPIVSASGISAQVYTCNRGSTGFLIGVKITADPKMVQLKNGMWSGTLTVSGYGRNGTFPFSAKNGTWWTVVTFPIDLNLLPNYNCELDTWTLKLSS